MPLELAGAPDAFERARAGTHRRRSRRAPHALSGATFRRRAAARRDRARAGAESGDPGRRRADRQSRRGDRTADRRSAVRRPPRPQDDAGAGDARSRAGGALRPSGPVALGPRGSARECSGMSVHHDQSSPSGALPLRLALRELRGGLRGFAVFIACIALGVMTIAAVGSFARSLTDGLAREGRTILGADIAFSLLHREASEDERAFLARAGHDSRPPRPCGRWRATVISVRRWSNSKRSTISIRSTARSARTGAAAADALALRDGAYGAAVDQALLARLDLPLGARIHGRRHDHRVARRHRQRARQAVGRCRLRPAPDGVDRGVARDRRWCSPAAWCAGLTSSNCPTTRRATARPTRSRRARSANFPQAGWEVRTRANASPALERNIERFTQFLTLVGLTALLVGGVGVANAVKSLCRAQA